MHVCMYVRTYVRMYVYIQLFFSYFDLIPFLELSLSRLSAPGTPGRNFEIERFQFARGGLREGPGAYETDAEEKSTPPLLNG